MHDLARGALPGAALADPPPRVQPAAAVNTPGVVNINAASAEELGRLPGERAEIGAITYVQRTALCWSGCVGTSRGPLDALTAARSQGTATAR